MFCVIQKVPLKKVHNGEPREILVRESTFIMNGVTKTNYYYEKGGGYFDRPNKWAYRISIHSSYRKDGKVYKRQVAICTIGYYDIAKYGSYYRDFINDNKLKEKRELLGISEQELDELIYAKLDPLNEQIQAEFQQSEEYATLQEHERIISAYNKHKAEFTEKYSDCESYYTQIYDVFGNVRNPELLVQVQEAAEARKEYEERSWRNSRSYYEKFNSNYSDDDTGSSYGGFGCSNYTKADKEILKQFYRSLSKKYHPDANPEADTSAEMQLLNQLKGEWGL